MQPPPPTPEEKAEALRLADLATREPEEGTELEWETQEWGGTLPSDRVRTLPGSACAGAILDRDLAEALAAATPDEQTLVARWIVRRAFAEAGLTRVAWIAELLTVMDDGGDLTPIVYDQRAAWDLLLSDPNVPRTVVTTLDGRADNFLQQAAAFGAVFALGLDDPLHAALEAFWAAANAFGHGRTDELAAEVRAAFPKVAARTPD